MYERKTGNLQLKFHTRTAGCGKPNEDGPFFITWFIVLKQSNYVITLFPYRPEQEERRESTLWLTRGVLTQGQFSQTISFIIAASCLSFWNFVRSFKR